eukprot:7069373-Pyramimonas_sp.AAC.1
MSSYRFPTPLATFTEREAEARRSIQEPVEIDDHGNRQPPLLSPICEARAASEGPRRRCTA